MRKGKLYILAFLAALGLLLWVGHHFAVSANTFELKMRATLIRADGVVFESTDLTITGTYPKENTPGETILYAPIEMQMELGKEIGYRFGHWASPMLYSKLPGSGTGEIMHLPGSIYEVRTNSSLSGKVGLDLQKEAFIFVFDDYPTHYIVASTDDSQTPEELMAYFATFIASYTKK